jgi:AcrR family transcriptional regulator
LILATNIERSLITDSVQEMTPAKVRLIIAGEALLGTDGIDQVPLQEIAAAAGHANKYAVQYHFGSREKLIEAIFAVRLRSIERRQRELLDIASKRQLLDRPIALFELMFLPIAEQMDLEGRHSYARFLLQFVTRPRFDHSLHHPLRSDDDPVNFVYGRLAALLSLDGDHLLRRLYSLTLAFLGALIARDNAVLFGRSSPSLDSSLSDIFAMMAMAISAEPEPCRGAQHPSRLPIDDKAGAASEPRPELFDQEL